MYLLYLIEICHVIIYIDYATFIFINKNSL